VTAQTAVTEWEHDAREPPPASTRFELGGLGQGRNQFTEISIFGLVGNGNLRPCRCRGMRFATGPSPLAGNGRARRARPLSANPSGTTSSTSSAFAADYIHGTQIEVAFVSTNSISQGEQVSVLWTYLLSRYRVKIRFAHRTFAWESEARGKAHVHVVIIGFGLSKPLKRFLFDYETPTSDPVVREVTNINPYLVDGPSLVVEKRMRPISPVPEMDFGSKAADFGHLTLSEEERAELIEDYPHREAMASSVAWIRGVYQRHPPLLSLAERHLPVCPEGVPPGAGKA
jgi:hypothetical protein